MYDRRAGDGGPHESLWSQLLARAIAGPAAGRGDRLRALPCAVIGWGEWLSLHPETTVLDRVPALVRRYKQTSYAIYFRSSDIKFPVQPPPPPDGPDPKEPVIAVTTNSGTRAWTFTEIAEHADQAGIWRERLGDTELTFHYRQEPRTVRVAAVAPEAIQSVTYAFWFAWHAMGTD